MPNRNEHQITGAIVGGSLALAKSNGQSVSHRTIEIIAGLIAGYYLACLPDILEPADSPNHRSLAHGAAPGVALISACINQLDSLQSLLRAHADQRATLAKQALTPGSELWNLVLELLFRLLAGAAAGAVGGYGSHLALDGFSQRGLPLVA